MPIDASDAAAALAFANSRVLTHTDCVLVVQADGRVALASCVLVEVPERRFAVTCAHVLRSEGTYFIGPNRLGTDRIPDDPGPGVRAARLVSTNHNADLALFEIPDDDPRKRAKRSYPLNHADVITEALISAHLKTASFICGIFGNASRALQYPDGLVYTQLPFYSAIGPIESCTADLIIADMAEKEVLHRDAAFPQLREFEATGGVRELGGISGSGLWLRSGEEMFLAGIVLGRSDGNPDQHLIRVTPVWMVRAWITATLSEEATKARP